MKNKISYKFLYPATLLDFIKGLIETIAGLIIANFTSKIVENAMGGKTDSVINISLYFACFIIAYQLVILIFNLIGKRLSAKLNQKFKIQVYESFLEQDLHIIKKLGVGDLNENFTNDIETVFKLFTKDTASFASGMIMSVSYLIFIGNKNPILATALFIIGFVQIISPIIFEKFMVQNYDNTRDIESELTDYVIDGYEGMATIKLYNLKSYYIDGLSNIHKKYLKVGIKSEVTAQANNSMDSGIDALLKFGVYSLVGWLILKKQISVETGISAIVLSAGLFSSMKAIFTTITHIKVGSKAANRLGSLVTRQDSAHGNTHKIDNNSSNVAIKVENLSFSYGNFENKKVLNDISFEIEKGDIAVIEGENGSGKTTLLNIVLGLYNNYNGNIYIHGNNLKEMSKSRYYDEISYLSQDEIGFTKSPIDFFEMLSKEKQIDYVKAMELANELGLSDKVLKTGIINNLSGGEMKKVYLIASLLKKGNTIVLDEPGNSLDANAKEIIKRKILNCCKTVIMITHDEFFSDVATCNIKISDGCADFTRNEVVLS